MVGARYLFERVADVPADHPIGTVAIFRVRGGKSDLAVYEGV